MLQISADLTVLSQSQREALADFISTFPGKLATNSGDDPIRPCPKVEVDPSLWPPEPAMLTEGDEGYEEPLPVFDAPLPPGVGEFSSPVGVVANVLTMPAPAGGPSQVDPPTLDKTGLPWDDRIHASSKAKTQDGSWRTKRGVDAGLLAAVQAELRGIMGLPNPSKVGVGEVSIHTFGALSNNGPLPVPPPPVVPAAAVPSITSSPVVSAPTVAPAVSPAPFISLVSFAGAKSLEGKLSDAEIEAACKTVGVNSLTLMTNRHDLCPFVEASLRQLVASR